MISMMAALMLATELVAIVVCPVSVNKLLITGASNGSAHAHIVNVKGIGKTFTMWAWAEPERVVSDCEEICHYK